MRRGREGAGSPKEAGNLGEATSSKKPETVFCLFAFETNALIWNVLEVFTAVRRDSVYFACFQKSFSFPCIVCCL